MAYLPIENYGVIGNLRTAALVGTDGSIDWLCLPRFDSPSVFGALLDDKIGGSFKIAPIGDDLRPKQVYWPETNILITRFLHADGIGELEDYMPVSDPAGDAVRKEKPEQASTQLIRRVRVVRGSMSFRLQCRPGFNYARDAHRTTVGEHGVRGSPRPDTATRRPGTAA